MEHYKQAPFNHEKSTHLHDKLLHSSDTKNFQDFNVLPTNAVFGSHAIYSAAHASAPFQPTHVQPPTFVACDSYAAEPQRTTSIASTSNDCHSFQSVSFQQPQCEQLVKRRHHSTTFQNNRSARAVTNTRNPIANCQYVGANFGSPIPLHPTVTHATSAQTSNSITLNVQNFGPSYSTFGSSSLEQPQRLQRQLHVTRFDTTNPLAEYIAEQESLRNREHFVSPRIRPGTPRTPSFCRQDPPPPPPPFTQSHTEQTEKIQHRYRVTSVSTSFLNKPTMENNDENNRFSPMWPTNTVTTNDSKDVSGTTHPQTFEPATPTSSPRVIRFEKNDESDEHDAVKVSNPAYWDVPTRSRVRPPTTISKPNDPQYSWTPQFIQSKDCPGTQQSAICNDDSKSLFQRSTNDNPLPLSSYMDPPLSLQNVGTRDNQFAQQQPLMQCQQSEGFASPEQCMAEARNPTNIEGAMLNENSPVHPAIPSPQQPLQPQKKKTFLQQQKDSSYLYAQVANEQRNLAKSLNVTADSAASASVVRPPQLQHKLHQEIPNSFPSLDWLPAEQPSTPAEQFAIQMRMAEDHRLELQRRKQQMVQQPTHYAPIQASHFPHINQQSPFQNVSLPYGGASNLLRPAAPSVAHLAQPQSPVSTASNSKKRRSSKPNENDVYPLYQFVMLLEETFNAILVDPQTKKFTLQTRMSELVNEVRDAKTSKLEELAYANETRVRSNKERPYELQKEIYNAALNMLYVHFEMNQIQFGFPKEILKYYLATYNKLIVVKDFANTNVASKNDKKNMKNTSIIGGGLILFEFGKSADSFVASMTRTDPKDIAALKFIMRNGIRLPRAIYFPINDVEFSPPTLLRDENSMVREDYHQINSTHYKQMHILITREIVMVHDGCQFVVPTIAIERDFTASMRFNSNMKPGDYFIIDVLVPAGTKTTTQKIQLVDVFQYHFKNSQSLPTALEDRIELVKRAIPEIPPPIFAPQQTPQIAIDVSYIQKPKEGFGPSYIYTKHYFTAAAIGTCNKCVVLAYAKDDSTLVRKATNSILGPVSYMINAMPKSKCKDYKSNGPSNNALLDNSVDDEEPPAIEYQEADAGTGEKNLEQQQDEPATIMHQGKVYTISGDLTDVQLFKKVITVEVRENNRLSYSTRPITTCAEYKPPSNKKETDAHANEALKLSKDFDKLLAKIEIKKDETGIADGLIQNLLSRIQKFTSVTKNAGDTQEIQSTDM